MSQHHEVPPIGPILPCTNRVAVTVEAYRPAKGIMHGTLDWSVTSCQEHEREHVIRIQTGTQVAPGASGNAFVLDGSRANRDCGDVFDYVLVRLVKNIGDRDG